jgi:hypothetical protein
MSCFTCFFWHGTAEACCIEKCWCKDEHRGNSAVCEVALNLVFEPISSFLQHLQEVEGAVFSSGLEQARSMY